MDDLEAASLEDEYGNSDYDFLAFEDGGGGFNLTTHYQNYSYPEMTLYSKILTSYVKPVSTCIGIVTNVFMLVLILNSKLRKLAPMIYVAGVALTDAGYLMFNVFSWIQSHFQVDVYNLVGMCQLVNYSVKAFTFLSRWYTTAFSTERFIWEFLPERRAELCNVFRTKLVLIGIAVLAIYGHVYFCWFLEVSEVTNFLCIVPFANIPTFTTLLRIDMVFTFMLPYGLIIVISAIVAVRKVRCRGRHVEAEARPCRTLGLQGRLQIVDNREERTRHLHATGILLCYTLSMIILTVPVNIRNFFGVMFSEFVIPHGEWTNTLDALSDLHFAIKFFICLLVSPKFRHCAKRFLCKSVCKESNRKMTRPNSNSINLQEFTNEECSDGTLIAVV